MGPTELSTLGIKGDLVEIAPWEQKGSSVIKIQLSQSFITFEGTLEMALYTSKYISLYICVSN